MKLGGGDLFFALFNFFAKKKKAIKKVKSYQILGGKGLFLVIIIEKKFKKIPCFGTVELIFVILILF